MNQTLLNIATLALALAGIGHAPTLRKARMIDAEGKEVTVELEFDRQDRS
jgi:hypothetical protein